jgi:hypothetical protein
VLVGAGDIAGCKAIDGATRTRGYVDYREAAGWATDVNAALERKLRGDLPKALAHDILNARPYAFMDDAPLEERRTQAVYTRRAGEPSGAGDLGALDAAAIERVRDEARPDPRDPDELHDALLSAGFLTQRDTALARWWELTRVFGELHIEIIMMGPRVPSLDHPKIKESHVALFPGWKKGEGLRFNNEPVGFGSIQRLKFVTSSGGAGYWEVRLGVDCTKGCLEEGSKIEVTGALVQDMYGKLELHPVYSLRNFEP